MPNYFENKLREIIERYKENVGGFSVVNFTDEVNIKIERADGSAEELNSGSENDSSERENQQ